MSRTLLVTLILVLSFVGLSDAWYLADMAFTGQKLVCNTAGLDGCNIVAQSAYAFLFGLPLAFYGVIFYALTFALAAVFFVIHKRRLFHTIFILGIVGLVASLAFEFIQIFLIKAICIYCLLSAFLSFLIFLFAWRLWHRHSPPKLAVVG